jgi:hypothetical protein
MLLVETYLGSSKVLIPGPGTDRLVRIILLQYHNNASVMLNTLCWIYPIACCNRKATLLRCGRCVPLLAMNPLSFAFKKKKKKATLLLAFSIVLHLMLLLLIDLQLYIPTTRNM